MTSSWFVFFLLAIAAAVFMIWPLLRSAIRRTNPDAEQRLQANVQLFREHLAELDISLAEGRIDTTQFDQLKLELERNLLADAGGDHLYTMEERSLGARVLIVAAMGLIAVAAGFYWQWGSAPDVAIAALQQEKHQQDYQDLLHNREPDPARGRALIDALEKRLLQKPQNAQNWFLLARTAMAEGDFDRAVEAYQRILALDPNASIVMAELAQALFLRDGNRMSREIFELARRSLAIDPQNTTALGLAGIYAYESKDFSAAVDYWQRAVTVLGPEAPGSKALSSGIAGARAEAAKAEKATPSAEGPRIHLEVQASPALAQLSPALPVFIYARAWGGGRMPLAIQRLTLGDLPAQVTLDESMAMSPAQTLAQATQVEVVARVAVDGSATAKPGDWEGRLGPLNLDKLPQDIRLTIDQQVSE